ncbi:hypothetical protein [Egicoccus sp. AB-alg2]|uniref:hypothetical protein n=1 Tax=Egicoccus sp. AB-alg2 TaxID=3242693 RepID=UPI00359D45A4
MANITRLVGGVLVAIGVIGYVATSGAHVTALLPAVLGLVIGVLGLVADRIDAGQHAIHASLALALLGALGSLPRVAGIGEGSPAAIASLLTVVVCLGYVALGVRSFAAARRARQEA